MDARMLALGQQIQEAAEQMNEMEIQAQVDRLMGIANEWNDLATDMHWKKDDIASMYLDWSWKATQEATMWATAEEAK